MRVMNGVCFAYHVCGYACVWVGVLVHARVLMVLRKCPFNTLLPFYLQWRHGGAAHVKAGVHVACPREAHDVLLADGRGGDQWEWYKLLEQRRSLCR